MGFFTKIPKPIAQQDEQVDPFGPEPTRSLTVEPDRILAPADPNAPVAPQQPTTQTWTQPWTDGANFEEFGAPQYTSSNYAQQAPSGWDAQKWSDPQHQTPKYVMGRILSSYNLGDPAQLQAAVDDITRAYPGAQYLGADSIRMPWGETIDIVRDYGGENGISYRVEGADQGVDPAAAAAESSWASPTAGMTTNYGASNAPAVPTSTGAQPASGVDPTMDAAMREAIMKLLTPEEVNPETLRNSPQFQAVQLAGQRAEERQRAQNAERASLEGWNDSGGWESDILGLQQARGEFEAGELGNLASEEVAARRQEITQGIQFAMANNQFALAQSLQRELAALDAQIKREGLSQQNSQFFSDLNERARQHGLNLGFNYTSLQTQANRDALLAALGG